MPEVTIRHLYATDLKDGNFLNCLREISPIELSLEEAKDIYRQRLCGTSTTYIALIEDSIVGTASIAFEKKFIHGGGVVAYIEDVAVTTNHKGNGIGTALIEYLVKLSRKRSCYKVILNCQPNLIPFYTHCGFHQSAIQMRIDLPPEEK